jgi:hypothetical protein
LAVFLITCTQIFAQKQNIDVEVKQTMGRDDNGNDNCPNLEFQMERLKSSRLRVFGLFAISGDAICILKAAKAANLIGPGYFWIGFSVFT